MPEPKRHHGAFDLARYFVERARLAASDADLRNLLDAVSRELGFRYFALIHHVDLRRSSPGVIQLENYPPAWSARFIQRRQFLDDPVLHASLRTNVGFGWDAIPKMIRLTPRQRGIFEAAAREGIGTGFTVPAHVPGESCGSISFVVPPGHALPKRGLLAAELIGVYAFEAARRIRRLVPETEPPRLTERQRECLIWAARGKTDGEIATILGIGEETVTKHMNAARECYDVVRRQQLIVAALFDGQISFLETLH